MSKRKVLERACLATDLQWGRVSGVLDRKADILTGIELTGDWALVNKDVPTVIANLVFSIEEFMKMVEADIRTRQVMVKLVSIEEETDKLFTLMADEKHPEILIRLRSLVVCQETVYQEVMALDACLQKERDAASAARSCLWKKPIQDSLERCTDGFYRTLDDMGLTIPPVLLPL